VIAKDSPAFNQIVGFSVDQFYELQDTYDAEANMQLLVEEVSAENTLLKNKEKRAPEEIVAEALARNRDKVREKVFSVFYPNAVTNKGLKVKEHGIEVSNELKRQIPVKRFCLHPTLQSRPFLNFGQQ
jgi:hypothetical protein